MRWIVVGLVLAVVAVAAYVRLAPVREGAYFALPSVEGPGDTDGPRSFTAVRETSAEPAGVLQAVIEVAEATPRTRLLEGSVAQERLVFITRSALWGFPDFTTVGFADGLLVVHARARFGQSDLGVNRARVQDWLAQLAPVLKSS